MSKKFEIEGALLAHGIELISRHGILREMKEMLAFAELAGRSWVRRYLKGVHYDSGANIAEFEFFVEPEEFDPIVEAVAAIASKTLRQFLIQGTARHGEFVAHEEDELVATVPVPVVEVVQ